MNDCAICHNEDNEDVIIAIKGTSYHKNCWEERDTFLEIEEMWNRIPNIPDGTRCEMDDCYTYDEFMYEWEENGSVGDKPLPPLAETSFVRFENGHTCYIFVCENCGESRSSDDFYDYWPENEDGSLVEPTRCS